MPEDPGCGRVFRDIRLGGRDFFTDQGGVAHFRKASTTAGKPGVEPLLESIATFTPWTFVDHEADHTIRYGRVI